MTGAGVTQPVSLLPAIPGAFLPPANPLELSDDEQRAITGLSAKLSMQALAVMESYAYYDGVQAIRNLGISVPAVLAGVRQVVDWPRITVDRLVERSSEIDGFRRPGATEVDAELGELWQSNDMDAELPLLQQDSLAGGRGYLVVGAPDSPGEAPIATVESPLNLTLVWDPRRRMVTVAYQSYEVEGVYRAALYLPDVTISMSRDEAGTWQVDRRDQHNFGEVPVVRFPNRARSSDREGRSQITPAVRQTTDSACRSLLGMEIAREVYAIPRLAILGASESDFVDQMGVAKRAIDMAMTKVLALERDAEGEIPTVQQLTAFDPSVFTKIIDEHAQLMASYTGFPPSYFGQSTASNPASADAIRVGLDGVERGAKRAQQQATGPLRKSAGLLWRFAHRGEALPEEMRRLSVDWSDASTPTPAADADAMAKQAAAGFVSPGSSVALRRLRYTALERALLAQDRAKDQAAQLEAELTSSIAGRTARAGNAIANDLGALPVPRGDAPQPPQSR